MTTPTFTLTDYVQQLDEKKKAKRAEHDYDSLPFSTRAAIVNAERRKTRREAFGKGPETVQKVYAPKLTRLPKRVFAVPRTGPGSQKNFFTETVAERFVTKTSGGKNRPSRRTKVGVRLAGRITHKPSVDKDA